MLSTFLEYLASSKFDSDEPLPTLSSLSEELGVSLSSLREQLEVARALGFIEIKPRAGMRKLPFNFSDSVKVSTLYGIKKDPELFKSYTNLRNHLELSYWYEAASQLTISDISEMCKLVNAAKQKLSMVPPQLPSSEHRSLHMTLYSKLDNIFVVGLLDTYWDLFEEFGYNDIPDREYQEKVWLFHSKIVESLKNRDFTLGYNLMREHMDLLNQRTSSNYAQSFE